MMHPSRRGAARVGVIWIVVVLVAFFAAAGIAFIFSDDASTAREQLVAAQADKARAEQLLQEERAAYREVSTLVGYYDRSAATARTEAAALRAGLEEFKNAFSSSTGPDVKDLETAMGRSVAAYRQVSVTVSELQQSIAQLRNESSQKSTAMDQLSASKDEQLNELRGQIRDAEQAARTRQDDLQRELTQVRSTLGSTESELTRSRTEAEQQVRSARDKELEYQTRFKEMSSKLAFLREPERPDGQLLAVSKDLGLGWIDLGKRNRLFAGMSFRIVDGGPGSTKVKAWAEVRKVQDEMAEVLITQRADPFDPPVPGDVIYNPLYDPVGGRNAVLVGRFSGTYNESELKALLAEIGIHVQAKLDKTTDYLVVGSELYHDEDGEPLDEPVQPSDTPTYKEAEAMGVQIVPMKQVREYFRSARN